MTDVDNQPQLSADELNSLFEVLNRPPGLPTHEPIPTGSYRSFTDWLKEKIGYVPQPERE